MNHGDSCTIMNRNTRHSPDTEKIRLVRALLNESSSSRGDERNGWNWRQGCNALATSIRDAQDNLSAQGIYKAELMGAIKRIRADHTREINSEAKQLKLTNQDKRAAELNRRLSIDSQQSTFNEDLKKINQKMSDLEIEIEYNRNMLKIRLAEVAGAANGIW